MTFPQGNNSGQMKLTRRNQQAAAIFFSGEMAWFYSVKFPGALVEPFWSGSTASNLAQERVPAL
jgi:hypothetical protein